MVDLPFWTYDGFAGERVIVVRGDTETSASLVPLSPTLVPGLLRAWLANPPQRRRLLDMHEALFGRSFHEAWAAGDISAEVFHNLRAAFERGNLLLLVRPDLAAPAPGPEPQLPSPRPDVQKRSFIEIELLDDDGRRVAAELVVTLPDGGKLRPAFSGFIRIDGIDPGTCDIEFPAIDGREWGPARSRR